MSRMNRGFWVLLALTLVLLAGRCTNPSSPDDEEDRDSIATAAPTTDIRVADLHIEPDSLRISAPRVVTARSGYDNQPAFLPDGSGLVWTSIRDGQGDVYRWRFDDAEPTQLTETPESEFSPTPRPSRRMTLVRVESDGRQRLWTYDDDGDPGSAVLPERDSIGYHAWIDPSRVALFVLGSPPTLHVVNVETGTDTTVASRIGRCLQPVPGATAISYVQVADDSTTAVHVFDGSSLMSRRIAPTPGTSRGDFHAWTPEGDLLMADGGTLLHWKSTVGEWAPVDSLAESKVSRLAISPSGDRLAFVVAE